MRHLAEMLEREGGRVVAAFAFLILAGCWAALKLPKSEELTIAAATLIARELMGGSK